MFTEVLYVTQVFSQLWCENALSQVCVCLCVLSRNVFMNAPDTTPTKYSVKLFIVVLFVLPNETRLDFKNRRSVRPCVHLQQWWKKY